MAYRARLVVYLFSSRLGRMLLTRSPFCTLSFHPTLLQILKKERMGPLVEYAAMYRQLGRTDVFRGDYCKARAAAAHKRWFASASSSPAGGVVEAGTTGSGLAAWLPSFLEYLQVMFCFSVQ